MDTSLLIWAKGTALQFATVVFVVGLSMRILQILVMGRAPDYSKARDNNVMSHGMKTVFRRFWPKHMMKGAMFTYVTGYIFHVGFLVVLIFYAPHIEFFQGAFGISWPSLYTSLIDAITVITLLTLIAVLINRIRHPVQRMLSNCEDYLAWLVTFLPLLTGYFSYHHLLLPYDTMLALHILSVELLMIIIPFTKLSHMATLFIARWYNGAVHGRKGVQS